MYRLDVQVRCTGSMYRFDVQGGYLDKVAVLGGIAGVESSYVARIVDELHRRVDVNLRPRLPRVDE